MVQVTVKLPLIQLLLIVFSVNLMAVFLLGIRSAVLPDDYTVIT